MTPRPSTTPEQLPAGQSPLQGLAFEALDDAWRLGGTLFNDSEAAVAVACTQAVVLAIADLTNELRATRRRADRALQEAFGAAAAGGLEAELHPNGEGYQSAGS